MGVCQLLPKKKKKKKTWDAFWQKMDGLRLQILHGIFSTKKMQVFRGPGFWGVNSVRICRILGAIQKKIRGSLSQPL